MRELAAALEVSPATVAAAYRELKRRGFVVTDGARGTSVAPVPPARVTRVSQLPTSVHDLSSGNPDPQLLPSLAEIVTRLEPNHRLYGVAAKLPELESLSAEAFAADGVRGDIAITGGGVDAIERALQTELRPGDRVVVEDPSWPRIADLLRSLGLTIEPVPVDDRGLDPDLLDAALRRGARAVITTPRGQNPSSAATDPTRGRELRAVHARYLDVLVIEDDYIAGVAGAKYVPVHSPDGRWTVVRSLSKVLGPDLRIALVAGDALTISRLEGRQRLGPGWISYILQQIATLVLRDAATARLFERAAQAYAERRQALVRALAARGVEAAGHSGLGVWVPLKDEAAAVRELLVAGWAVSPGERFRFNSSPGIRITTANLHPDEAERLADTIASLGHSAGRTYTG